MSEREPFKFCKHSLDNGWVKVDMNGGYGIQVPLIVCKDCWENNKDILYARKCGVWPILDSRTSEL